MSRYEKYLKIQESKKWFWDMVTLRHTDPRQILCLMSPLAALTPLPSIIMNPDKINPNIWAWIFGFMLPLFWGVYIMIFLFIRFLYHKWITSRPFYFDIDIKEDIEFDME